MSKSNVAKNLDTLPSVKSHLSLINKALILFLGGSTIVLLFEKGMVEWDEDLLINGRASVETLVRVGMGVGRRRSGHSSS